MRTSLCDCALRGVGCLRSRRVAFARARLAERQRAGRFARPHRGRALDQARPLSRLRQFRLARLHRAQLALADRPCPSRRCPTAPRRSAIPAPASGRPSRPAMNCSRSVRTGARSRLSPGRPTKRRTRAERMSTIARRRSRPSIRSWISINPPSCPASAPIRWWRKIGTYTRYEGRINEPEYSALALTAGAWARTCPIRPILRNCP